MGFRGLMLGMLPGMSGSGDAAGDAAGDAGDAAGDVSAGDVGFRGCPRAPSPDGAAPVSQRGEKDFDSRTR